jgi:hypothetical protein
VKITSLTNSVGYDFSNNNFTIGPGSITVVSPNGGEAWQKGTTHVITWTDNVCENVRIELWKGGVYNSLITASTPSTGSFTWAIPNNNTLANGNDYKVKIMVPLNSGTTTTVYDFSDANFTIGNQCLILLVPNGGEVWYGGGTYVIKWIDCIAENIRIELWKGGVYNSLICQSANGSYTWTIPAAIVAGNDYKVKIIGGTNSSGGNFDFSDANFTINQGPFIIVTSPNGGEFWARGTTHIITWIDNIASDVRIELWKGGVFNSLISAQTPSSGSCYWAIPATVLAGNDYKVKVTALSNTTNAVFDFSDNYFTIVGSNIWPSNVQKSAIAEESGQVMKIYPNPCSDLLYVDLADGSSAPCNIEIMDLTGKTVLRQDVPENTTTADVGTTNLGEGYYILIIRRDHEMIFKKGLVIRH